MTVVYLDTLFLLNAVMDYLLLLCSARIAGERLHRTRMAAGAVLGGGYAVAAVLPKTGFLMHPAVKVGAALVMVVVGLGASRRLLRQCIIFFALACAFGGGVLAIGLLGGNGLSLGGGLVYSGMDIKIVLLSAAGCYLLFTLGMSRMGQHTSIGGELVRVTLRLFEREVELNALVDTGNTLNDPVTGKAAMVVQADRVSELFWPDLVLKAEELTRPDHILTRLNRGRWRGRFRLLPYRTVGVECGMLLAVRADELTVNGKRCGTVLVALSPTPLSDGGGYHALVDSTCGK